MIPTTIITGKNHGDPITVMNSPPNIPVTKYMPLLDTLFDIGTPRYSIDGEPGQIIKALVRCGIMNPVILLDEIEKSSGNAGLLNNVMATLLEILDPEQNATFVDHYIDYPVDLSKVFFICTANNLGGLSAALLDRVEVIRFTSYTDEEKETIAKDYILPKVYKNLHLSSEHVKIEDDVWISRRQIGRASCRERV